MHMIMEQIISMSNDHSKGNLNLTPDNLIFILCLQLIAYFLFYRKGISGSALPYRRSVPTVSCV